MTITAGITAGVAMLTAPARGATLRLKPSVLRQ